MTSVKLRAASVASTGGPVVYSFEIEMPRAVLAEFNTHRLLSRNTASSRAIPVRKMLNMTEDNMYMPNWTKNKKGMVSNDTYDENEQLALDAALDLYFRDTQRFIEVLIDYGVHKQDANRYLEPFQNVTTILTATSYDNFLALRTALATYPPFQEVARQIAGCIQYCDPTVLSPGEWHLPFAEHCEGLLIYDKIMVNVARCARVSYLTHGSETISHEADFDLYNRLLAEGHMSPFEHVCRPANIEDMPLGMIPGALVPSLMSGNLSASDIWFGNFKGWVSHRRLLSGECDFLVK